MTGPELRAALDKLELSTADAGDMLGVSAITVQRWAAGSRRILPGTAILFQLLLAGKVASTDVPDRSDTPMGAAEFVAALQQLNLSKTAAAKLFRVSDQSIGHWTDGEHDMPNGTAILLRLMLAGKIEADDIATLAVNPSPRKKRARIARTTLRLKPDEARAVAEALKRANAKRRNTLLAKVARQLRPIAG